MSVCVRACVCMHACVSMCMWVNLSVSVVCECMFVCMCLPCVLQEPWMSHRHAKRKPDLAMCACVSMRVQVCIYVLMCVTWQKHLAYMM